VLPRRFSKIASRDNRSSARGPDSPWRWRWLGSRADRTRSDRTLGIGVSFETTRPALAHLHCYFWGILGPTLLTLDLGKTPASSGSLMLIWKVSQQWELLASFAKTSTASCWRAGDHFEITAQSTRDRIEALIECICRTNAFRVTILPSPSANSPRTGPAPGRFCCSYFQCG